MVVVITKTSSNDQTEKQTHIIEEPPELPVIDTDSCEINEFFDLVDRARSYDIYVIEDDQDLKTANDYYKEAINPVDHTFGIVLSGAFKTALAFKDFEWAEELAIKLAKGGVPRVFFERTIDRTNDYSWDNFYDNFPSYQEHFYKEYDMVQRNRILSLFHQDSMFNARKNFWFDPTHERFNNIPPEGYRESSFTYDSIIYNTRLISNEFIDIINTYGIPSEKDVGFRMLGGQLSLYHYTPLIHHIRSRGDTIPIQEVNSAFCSGAIERRSYKAIINILTTFTGNVKENTKMTMEKREENLKSQSEK